MKQLLEKLNLGTKVNLIVITVLSILLIAIAVLVNISTRNLSIAMGLYRVGQEAEVVQGRFYEAEQDVWAATKLLTSKAGLVQAVADGDMDSVRTMALIGAAPLNLDDINIVDADGARLVTMIDKESEIFNIAQEDALLSLALIGIENTGIIIKEGPRLEIVAAIPLRDVSGDTVGAVLSSREVDDDFLAEINFSRKDIHLALIHEGQILTHCWTEDDHISMMEGAVSMVLLDQSAIRQALSGQTVVSDDLVNVGGTQYALAHIPLTIGGETNVIIGSLVDMSELAVFQRRLTNNLGILSTFLALVALVTTTLFIRQSVAVPLHNLELVTEQMANGDYQKRAQVTTMDETGRLAHAFNTMAGAVQEREVELVKAYQVVERRVEEQTSELQRETNERERLQKEIIEAQKLAIQKLSAPVIPVMDRIIVMPLIGSIDSMRARDITRSLLAGIRDQRAKVVILDITGVPLVDGGVANHLSKTIHAARLKGARTIITGISDAVAETIVDLGVDWSGIKTLSDLQTGLVVALNSLGIKLTK